MKSFLLNSDNKPIVKWGLIEPNTHFEGKVPYGFYKAVAPTGNYIVLDVDVKSDGSKNGFKNIPEEIQLELDKTFNYQTKSGGKHYWLRYLGNKVLLNRATDKNLDLRVSAKENNCGGYVRYYHPVDIRECTNLIKVCSKELNKWLESLFSTIEK